ncbi:hypothetical protein PISMIDRAFT_679090 [Pisolithus microcarpus 441]|uniref:Uncharacterized protein n=1 Tax=Pisolithus microcarpus 441 TaxID=765257 RepID=A0A0C9ZCI4_9AGAM|nr:hypothetical protein PISMIDRAFT_679090 [Pisolithus microcarpus 441]
MDGQCNAFASSYLNLRYHSRRESGPSGKRCVSRGGHWCVSAPQRLRRLDCHILDNVMLPVHKARIFNTGHTIVMASSSLQTS